MSLLMISSWTLNFWWDHILGIQAPENPQDDTLSGTSENTYRICTKKIQRARGRWEGAKVKRKIRGRKGKKQLKENIYDTLFSLKANSFIFYISFSCKLWSRDKRKKGIQRRGLVWNHFRQLSVSLKMKTSQVLIGLRTLFLYEDLALAVN